MASEDVCQEILPIGVRLYFVDVTRVTGHRHCHTGVGGRIVIRLEDSNQERTSSDQLHSHRIGDARFNDCSGFPAETVRRIVRFDGIGPGRQFELRIKNSIRVGGDLVICREVDLYFHATACGRTIREQNVSHQSPVKIINRWEL